MSILENADKVVELREKWLYEAQQAKEFIKLLPASIQQLEGEADLGATKCLDITCEGQYAKEVCEVEGATFEKLQLGRYDGKFYVRGVLLVEDLLKVQLYIHSVDKPPSCVLVERDVVKKEYEAVCSDSGEVVA